MRSASLPFSSPCSVSRKVVGVLAEKEGHLRVDDVARQHGVGVLRHALGHHDELPGHRVLPRRAARLHAEGRDLVRELEQRRIVGV